MDTIKVWNKVVCSQWTITVISWPSMYVKLLNFAFVNQDDGSGEDTGGLLTL
jgi:hypothetical protein